MAHILQRIRKKVKRFFAAEQHRRHSLVGSGDLYEMKREFQIHFLESAGLKPCHDLLDLGCGTLRGGIPVIDYLEEGRYCGVDVRESALGEAQKELRLHGLEHKCPLLVHVPEDLSRVDLGRKFDFIWAFSVFIHMRDEILLGALAFVSRHLKESGMFYGNVNIGLREARSWQGFPVVWRSKEFYHQAASFNGLHISDLGTLASLGHHSGNARADSQIMLQLTRVRGAELVRSSADR